MNIQPLQWIEVEEGNNTYKTGSRGVVVCKFVFPNYNVWDCFVLITRIGKKGKLRLVPNLIKLKHRPSKVLSKSDQSILDTVRIIESLEPIDAANRARNKVSDIKIKVVDDWYNSKNLMDMNGWDLLTYISALSLFLDQMAKSVNGFNRRMPDPSMNISMDMIDLLPTTRATILGKVIVNAVRQYYKSTVAIDHMINRVESYKHEILYRLIKNKSIMSDSIKKYLDEDKLIYSLMEERIDDVIAAYKANRVRLKAIKSAGSLSFQSPICANKIYNHLGNRRIGHIRPGKRVLNRTNTLTAPSLANNNAPELVEIPNEGHNYNPYQ